MRDEPADFYWVGRRSISDLGVVNKNRIDRAHNDRKDQNAEENPRFRHESNATTQGCRAKSMAIQVESAARVSAILSA